MSRGVNVVFWLAHPLPEGALSEFGFDLGTDSEAGRAAFFNEEQLGLLARKDNIHITTSGMNYQATLKLAHEVLGPVRVMFAVDDPFEENEEAVQAVDGAPFSHEDKTRIYQTNAERVFNLSAG
jgi:predicted TIM-barrel fold metal-dependent hydrolase